MVYHSSQFSWNFPAVGFAMFSKTLLKTRSLAWNVHCLTCLLCKFEVLCWYDSIRIATASRSSYVISKSLAKASVLASPGIYVRSVGIPAFVGIIASIP